MDNGIRAAAIVGLVAMVAGGFAAPAQAAPERYSYESKSANAFWYRTVKVKPGVTRRITWYVGVYQSSESTWSDVYKSVVRCRRVDGRRRCRTVQWVYGETDLSDGTFTLDKDLTAALIEGTYPLTTYRRGEAPSEEVPTHVSVTFEGEGQLSSDSGRSSYQTECYHSRDRWSWASRDAESYGSVGRLNLGETYDAWMNTYSSSGWTKTKPGCEDDDYYER